MPRPDDDIRLQHLIEAAEAAVAYAAERDRSALDDDELFRLAMTKLVEIVGEAAKQASDETRAPTRSYRGRRHPAHAIA